VGIIECAVDWVDEPLIFLIAIMLPTLLSLDAVIREVGVDFVYQKGFNGCIRFRDEIRLALMAYL